MRRLATALLPALLWSGTTPAQAGACPDLTTLPDLACVATGPGWFYADDASAAATLAEDARVAGARFAAHFARDAPRGAVVAAGAERTIDDGVRTALRDAGAHWMLPWFDASERTTLRRNAIERGLRTRHPDADEARIAALRDAAMAQTSASPGGADTDRGTLRHEIGHLLLIEAFWPDRSRDGPVSHYGGPGPDWLDETAGVLMETDAMADGRRHLLYGDEAPSRLRPLDEFFAMPHPMIAGILAARAQTPDAPSGGIRVLSGDAGRRVAGDAHWFYVQARGVADYLVARSGTPSVFAGIAAAAAAGDGFATWLATHGEAHGLPASMDALERDWQAWLASTRP